MIYTLNDLDGSPLHKLPWICNRWLWWEIIWRERSAGCLPSSYVFGFNKTNLKLVQKWKNKCWFISKQFTLNELDAIPLRKPLWFWNHEWCWETLWRKISLCVLPVYDDFCLREKNLQRAQQLKRSADKFQQFPTGSSPSCTYSYFVGIKY